VAKAKTKKTGTTKKELLDAAVAETVGAGKELHFESVDFSDPNRPKTCLEVDFPILPVNLVASLEATSGAAKKPIYQMSKWWARRQSSVFRAILIAAATKAPEDAGEAAKLVWDAYYGNHQKNAAFNNLKVADIFMGGGTTIVEGARLGMQMYGNDLNPVAWFVVKNELAQVDPSEVQKLLDHIEAEVKPMVMPFYACDCPRGHKGKWTQRSTGQVMGKTFDPLSLNSEERGGYEYEGPEVTYTFWSKHGPCAATGCHHRTPIMTSPVIAVKTLTVSAWVDRSCRKCNETFDIERYDARLAPAALFVCAPDQTPYAVMDETGIYTCPHCGHEHRDETARDIGESGSLGKAKNKSVELTLLTHPDWLRGAPGKSSKAADFGGSVQDDPDSTSAWHVVRQKAAKLIEVRGTLPDSIEVPDTKEAFFTDKRGGTIPKQSQFQCREATCGLAQEIMVSISKTRKSGPVAACAIQGFCPYCKAAGHPFDGRFFASPAPLAYDAAHREWDHLRNAALDGYWPRQTIPIGYMTPIQNDLPAHGFPDWWCMFNHRQLLIHSILLKCICTSKSFPESVKEFVLGAFQQYLRCNNMFTIWHQANNQISAFLSNNNFCPKHNVVETGVFNPIGDGSWRSSAGSLNDALVWSQHPWELVPRLLLEPTSPRLAEGISGKSVKVHPGDPPKSNSMITCGSATKLAELSDSSYDLVITDPPFGGLLHYSELSDFFYAWLRLPLHDKYPTYFGTESTPKALEAVSNKARHPDDHDVFYQKILTECWIEAARILKPAGILAFTFHHSEDEPWVAVLKSLFDAGFFLEATYPIRSDETKGDGQFGSKQIEFDIVHVCRKRVDETQEVSWARLRRQILADVRQLQDILEHHQQEGLQEADLQVIRRGKALEYYSKHYGKVFIEKGREFTVKEALAGINQLLDDQRDSTAEVPPVDAEPYTRQFLRLFADTTSLPRDQIQKYLRGTGVSPNEFQERGWCTEKSKVFHFSPPHEQAQKWKGVSRQGMGRDFDQAMFLIGACYENSGIRVQDTLNSEKFIPHPATGDVIDWFTRHGGDAEMKSAARLAKQLYTKWVAANEPKVKAAQRTFDFAQEEA